MNDHDNDDKYDGYHVKHRKFTGWVDQNILDFKLVDKIKNKYPYDEANPDTSFADFYIYKKF